MRPNRYWFRLRPEAQSSTFRLQLRATDELKIELYTISTVPGHTDCDADIWHVILTPDAGVAEWQTLRT